jgi:hypothetical protein
MVAKVAIYSLFRDNAFGLYITDYFKRIPNYPELRLYLVEGDSRDEGETFRRLKAQDYKVPTKVIKHDTGIERYGSVVNDRRFECLSRSANAALGAIAEDRWADYILLIESDLLYPPNLVDALVLSADSIDSFGAVAPTIWAGPYFYDVWGFVNKNNDSVGPVWDPTELTELNSVGSVVLYAAEPIYNGLRFDARCMRGLCEDLRKEGLTIWCNPGIRVNHPT